MAWYPGATKMELQPESDGQAATNACRTARQRSARYYQDRIRPRALAAREPCTQCGESLAGSPGRRICTTCAPDARAYSRVYLYGVDQVMFDAMYFEQGGACPLCEEREATHVDHCHSTGRVRGLLCHPCNTRLGGIEKAGWLDSALSYLAANFYLRQESS